MVNNQGYGYSGGGCTAGPSYIDTTQNLSIRKDPVLSRA